MENWLYVDGMYEGLTLRECWLKQTNEWRFELQSGCYITVRNGVRTYRGEVFYLMCQRVLLFGRPIKFNGKSGL
jgi:hypothetical protein